VLKAIVAAVAFAALCGGCIGLIFGINDVQVLAFTQLCRRIPRSLSLSPAFVPLQFKRLGLSVSAAGDRAWGQLYQAVTGEIGIGTDAPSALLEISSASDGTNKDLPTLRLAQSSVINRRRRLADATGGSIGNTKIEFGEYYGKDYVTGATLVNAKVRFFLSLSFVVM
jgi:hypothetical protein